MAKKVFRIRPFGYALDLSNASLNSNPLTAQWGTMNVRVSSNRIERRWDHTLFRTFDDTEVLQDTPIYRVNDGTNYILTLTDDDIVRIKGGTGETYQYLTDTYTTGTISSVVTTAVTGSSTAWLTSGLAAGDKFIVDSDHSASAEPDTNWATIASITDDTHLVLSAAYTGSGTGTYKARKVYSTPSGERWCYANVAGYFCFGNGNTRMQYLNGVSGYATDLNATYTNQARYCVPYADRLVVADVYDPDTSARNPWLMRWSKNGDPTDWTDTTAGWNEFLDSEEPIMGLGVYGDNLVVFRKTSFHLGSRTGQSTAPIQFSSHVMGVGCQAPYSIVPAAGTLMWIGVDNFYAMDGSVATAIGDPVRKKFFDLVSDDEVERVFGINNVRYNEVTWVANTSSGQYVVVYNWAEKQWYPYQFSNNVTGWGGSV